MSISSSFGQINGVTVTLTDAAGVAYVTSPDYQTRGTTYFRIDVCTGSTAVTNVQLRVYSNRFNSTFNGLEIQNLDHLSHSPVTTTVVSATAVGRPGQMLFIIPSIPANSCRSILISYKIIHTCGCRVNLNAESVLGLLSDSCTIGAGELLRTTDIGVNKTASTASLSVGQTLTYSV